GQHEVERRVLKHGVDPPDLATSLLLVGGSHERFEQRAPIARILHAWTFRGSGHASSLLRPQLQRALVGVEADRGGGIGAADTALTYFQPLAPVERACIDQPQGRSLFHGGSAKEK